jgi:hypothetical protein
MVGYDGRRRRPVDRRGKVRKSVPAPRTADCDRRRRREAAASHRRMLDEQRPSASSTSLRRGLSEWFGQPPRRHGEPILHRAVSYLELFYDLVYVVCISQASHTLAGDVSWAGSPSCSD